MRKIIALFKILVLCLICLITLPLQALNRLFFSKTKLFYVVPFAFHNSLRIVFGIRLKVDGDIQTNQQTVYVGNHMSYLDIPLLGSILKANFVSKDDVRQWPIFGTLAYLAKTIFISRAPSKALQSLKQINDALDQKENLIVFPEGTSTSGTDILPFKSSFFDLFLKHKMKDEILIQPFTVTMQTADKEQERSSEKLDQYAWYGDMDLQPHLWSLAMSKGVDMKVQFHPAIAVKDYDNRKKIAADCFSLTKSGHQSEKEAA